MTETQPQGPDLERRAGAAALGLMDDVPVGGPLRLTAGTQLCNAELCTVLEHLVPQLLASEHPEWRGESLDGFYLSHAVRESAHSVELAGTCVLITDQRVTPFTLNLSVSADGALDRIGIRLGEQGGGPLGISGPLSNSTAAGTLLLELAHRLDQIVWVYDLVVE